MIAVVDIGNARIKWARAHSGALSDHGMVPHLDDPDRAVDAFAHAFPEAVGRVVATNVAGEEMATRLSNVTRERWDLQPEWIETSASQLGVTCGYSEPGRLGADRWVAILAAHALADDAVCVIDTGTAVTLDAIDASGRHLGGLIMAGSRLAAAALDRQTSNIGQTATSGDVPQGLELLGRSTDEGVAHGSMLGVAAALDRAISVVTAVLDNPPVVLLTGGEAQALLPWLETEVQYRAHLVLEGLALIAAKS